MKRGLELCHLHVAFCVMVVICAYQRNIVS
jgi:hypothetical protein